MALDSIAITDTSTDASACSASSISQACWEQQTPRTTTAKDAPAQRNTQALDCGDENLYTDSFSLQSVLAELGSPGRDSVEESPKPERQTDSRQSASAVAESRGDATTTADVAMEQAKLADVAAQKMAGDQAELARFQKDMDALPQRSPPVSDAEVARTYQQVSDLLSAPENPQIALKAADRQKLAEQVMHQAADPTSIRQGSHGTCNAAVVEFGLYTKNPSEAAKLVKDMATTGRYTTLDGTTVALPPDQLLPDAEARAKVKTDGDRSHASQIFELTAINAYYKTNPTSYRDAQGNYHDVPPGKMEYQQLPTTDPSKPYDTGERLIDHSTKSPTPVMDDWKHKIPAMGPIMGDNDIARMGNMLSGKPDTVVVDHQEPDGPAPETGNLAHKYSTEEDFKAILSKAKEDGQMPIIMGVDANQPPFIYESNALVLVGPNAKKLPDAGHVITITDYDEKTGKVFVHNQWSSEHDHLTPDTAMSVHTLYEAGKDAQLDNNHIAGGQLADLNEEVKQDRQHDTIDPSKNLELVRERYNYTKAKEAMPAEVGELSTAGLRADTVKIMNDAQPRWDQEKTAGTFDQAEQDRTVAENKSIVDSMPAEQAIRVLANETAVDSIPPKQFDRDVATTMADAKDDNLDASQTQRFKANVAALLKSLPAERQEEIYKDFKKELKDRKEATHGSGQ